LTNLKKIGLFKQKTLWKKVNLKSYYFVILSQNLTFTILKCYTIWISIQWSILP